MKIYFQRHLMVFYTLSGEIQGSWLLVNSDFETNASYNHLHIQVAKSCNHLNLLLSTKMQLGPPTLVSLIFIIKLLFYEMFQFDEDKVHTKFGTSKTFVHRDTAHLKNHNVLKMIQLSGERFT